MHLPQFPMLAPHAEERAVAPATDRPFGSVSTRFHNVFSGKVSGAVASRMRHTEPPLPGPAASPVHAETVLLLTAGAPMAPKLADSDGVTASQVSRVGMLDLSKHSLAENEATAPFVVEGGEASQSNGPVANEAVAGAGITPANSGLNVGADAALAPEVDKETVFFQGDTSESDHVPAGGRHSDPLENYETHGQPGSSASEERAKLAPGATSETSSAWVQLQNRDISGLVAAHPATFAANQVISGGVTWESARRVGYGDGAAVAPGSAGETQQRPQRLPHPFGSGEITNAAAPSQTRASLSPPDGPAPEIPAREGVMAVGGASSGKPEAMNLSGVGAKANVDGGPVRGLEAAPRPMASASQTELAIDDKKTGSAMGLGTAVSGEKGFEAAASSASGAISQPRAVAEKAVTNVLNDKQVDTAPARIDPVERPPETATETNKEARPPAPRLDSPAAASTFAKAGESASATQGPDTGREPGLVSVADIAVVDQRPTERPGAQAGADIFHRTETSRHVAAQIVEVARGAGERGIELSLRPEELGRLNLVFETEGDALRVTVAVERPETLELLRRNIDLLGGELRRLGYGVVSFDFSGAGAGHSHGKSASGDPAGENRDAPRESADESSLAAEADRPGLNRPNAVSRLDGIDIRL